FQQLIIRKQFIGTTKSRQRVLDNNNDRLIQTLRLAHGRLDGERADVLPVLLEQRDEEVDSKGDVGDELLLAHLDVSDGDGEAENLLHLELDGGLDLVNLGSERFGVRDDGRELSGLVETRTEDTGDLLDERLGSEERIVTLGELLDELLVLVELLQVISVHAGDAGGVGLIAMLLVSKNTDLHVRLGDVLQSDGSGETLVLLGVVVLQTDLELDGLTELALLLLSSLDDLRDGLIQEVARDLAATHFY
ncbi:hypothetical protein PFISCL1PPCAC_20835, partial [Pristionchus fissidentatus]